MYQHENEETYGDVYSSSSRKPYISRTKAEWREYYKGLEKEKNKSKRIPNSDIDSLMKDENAVQCLVEYYSDYIINYFNMLEKQKGKEANIARIKLFQLCQRVKSDIDDNWDDYKHILTDKFQTGHLLRRLEVYIKASINVSYKIVEKDGFPGDELVVQVIEE